MEKYGCEFCEGNVEFFEDAQGETEYCVEVQVDNRLMLSNNCGIIGAIPIRFCPFCGAELNQ